MQRSGPWACGTKLSKRAPRLNDLTFKIFKKKEGGAPRAVGRLLKRGEVVSIVGLKKGGGVVHPCQWEKVIFSQEGGVVRPPTYGPGHMPVAQHIHRNLFFFTLIINLRALDRRIDYNQFYM